MNKKILILSEGKKISGPSTWKTGLVKNLQKTYIQVDEIDVTNISSFIKIFSLNQYSILHGYNISGLSVIYLLAGKILNKKVVFTLHGNFFSEVNSKKGIKKLLWVPFHKISLFLSDKVTVPSKYLYDLLSKQDKNTAKKIDIIYNGIEICEKCKKISQKKFGKDIKVLDITNFNILDKFKGLIPLIEAINKINFENKNIKIKLFVLGGGKYLNSFKNKYSNKNIEFLGRRTPVDNYIENADIFVHSTLLETFGYIILEAMSHNKPVISVNIGGISEILPNTSLTKPNKISLYNKLIYFINNQSFLDLQIKNNQKIINKFLWSKIVKQWVNLYAENINHYD